MLLPFSEPVAPRYLYINPETNQVHLLMPVVSGTEIGLDNTCRSVYALQEFFSKMKNPGRKLVTALDELTHYKETLELDISLITEESELKQQKKERLEQIKHYISLIETVQNSDVLKDLSAGFPAYPAPLKIMMADKRSNLYGMVLRPSAQDSFLRSQNTVFRVERTGNSHFYQALQNGYKDIEALSGAQARLTQAVLVSLEGKNIDFAGIQRVLAGQTQKMFGIVINYQQTSDKQDVTQSFIDTEMGYDSDSTKAEYYIQALLGYCAPKLFDTLIESPFYTAKNAEELSIVTQFFMAQVNIYCATKKHSSADFGAVLDDSSGLSDEMVARVISARVCGGSIEDALFDFVNVHYKKLQLTQPLTTIEMEHIKKQFNEQFIAIKDSPHFDEFMVLDANSPGLFVVHQGSICTDFCAFYTASQFENSFFVQRRCKEFETMNGVIPHKNESVQANFELYLEQITDDQLGSILEGLDSKYLPELFQLNPERVGRVQISKILPEFSLHVARGQQIEAEKRLKDNPNTQLLLITPGTFTDYSGRTFTCTAYEYAYWAKDKHMCRMLEQQMDERTKAEMLERCEAIERNGLTYTQHNEVITGSKHFSFEPLKTALTQYVQGWEDWYNKREWEAMDAAWLRVGLAQRDVPAHVAQEYCRSDRSFDPRPEFNEEHLPRSLTIYNFVIEPDGWFTEQDWFPLGASNSSGLGIDFAIGRPSEPLARPTGWLHGARSGVSRSGPARADLAAICHLDEVRTADLKQSLENLRPREPEQGLGMTS